MALILACSFLRCLVISRATALASLSACALTLARAFAPFFPILMNIDTRFTSMITNNFDIIDNEKILLKIANPVNSNEFIAMIYLWQKSFAEKMRAKFFDLWKNAKELNVDVKIA